MDDYGVNYNQCLTIKDLKREKTRKKPRKNRQKSENCPRKTGKKPGELGWKSGNELRNSGRASWVGLKGSGLSILGQHSHKNLEMSITLSSELEVAPQS